MPEPFDVTCSICGTPMLPNLSQADADGCLWICINPGCPQLCAGELHAQGAGHGEEGADAGGGGAPPWPPPRPTS